jgi:glycosyltransferase involved in cell wall biosynthesis
MLGGLVPWHPQAGGGQVIAYKVGEALSEAGHHVDYVAIAPPEIRRTVSWGSLIYSSEQPQTLWSVPSMVRMLRRGDLGTYDLVHLHAGNDTSAECLAYTLSRLVTPRPRLVLSIYYPKVHALPRSLGELVTLFCARRADLVCCLSEFSREDISQAYRIAPSKLLVTYAGVDTSFRPADRPSERADPAHPSLLFCGRLDGPREQKGVDILLRSVPLVLQKHNVRLRIVGTGPRLAQYRELAQDLGIGTHVEFVGFVEHDQMPGYYQQADLFVLPSRRESFGLVLAEAMSCGLPVVATTVGAIPEVVDDGVTGTLVPADDTQALAAAINSMLQDPDTMQAMGARGREKVARQFTWERVAQKIVGGYHRLL